MIAIPIPRQTRPWLSLVLAFALLVTTPVDAAQPHALQSANDLFLVKYQPNAKAAVAAEVQSLGGAIRYAFDDIRILAIRLDQSRADDLAAHPNVVSVGPNAIYQLFAQTTPYGIDMVQARDTWDANRDGALDPGAPTGSGIKVCIIDTGIRASHEDLGGGGVNILAGRSWVNEDWSQDGHGHGTHVAGTVAAMHNTTGVVGVSPGQASLLIADVFNDAGDGQDSAVILDAANWCADQGANIISMSLGGPIDDLLADGYQALYDRGILIVAAAGNDGAPVNSYPASYPSVMSIAAVDNTGTVADFSNFVPEVELAAPGVAVLSTWAEENSVQVEGGPKLAANPIEFADPAGSTSGPLANGGDCNTPPAPGAYQGKIVLCVRGGLPFKVKIDNAAAGGAKAVVLYNNEPGNFAGTYAACCSAIPAVSLSQEDGQTLVNNWLGATATVALHAASNTAYTEISGTSMATPHASGAAAVLWSACPALTNDQIRSHLDTFTTESEADLIAGRDVFYGYGIPQLKNAVDALSDGVNDYDPNDPNHDGNNPANVECPAQLARAEAEGGGWLKGHGNKKINFGFDVELTQGGKMSGFLSVNDRVSGAKIALSKITSFGEGGACDSLTPGEDNLEFFGTGTFNGAAASFRTCVADNGTPGKGRDAFYLECTAGCTYTTAASAADNIIDGGNIRVEKEVRNGAASQPASATTLILDPLLLTEGAVGQVQVFTVTVYDQHGERLPGASVSLIRTAAGGGNETLTAIADLTGTAIFNAVNLNQTMEYRATSGGAESNTIEVNPILR
jgi:subtilisin family serine protease